MWEKVTTFVKDVRTEFGRVSWPTRDELVGSTSVVLVFSIAFALFIGMFDLLISLVWRVLLGS
jgi:preprotein translocase subunit SecE